MSQKKTGHPLFFGMILFDKCVNYKQNLIKNISEVNFWFFLKSNTTIPTLLFYYQIIETKQRIKMFLNWDNPDLLLLPKELNLNFVLKPNLLKPYSDVNQSLRNDTSGQYSSDSRPASRFYGIWTIPFITKISRQQYKFVNSWKNTRKNKKIGVFLNENLETIIENVCKYDLDGVQIHGTDKVKWYGCQQ